MLILRGDGGLHGLRAALAQDVRQAIDQFAAKVLPLLGIDVGGENPGRASVIDLAGGLITPNRSKC